MFQSIRPPSRTCPAPVPNIVPLSLALRSRSPWAFSCVTGSSRLSLNIGFRVRGEKEPVVVVQRKLAGMRTPCPDATSQSAPHTSSSDASQNADRVAHGGVYMSYTCLRPHLRDGRIFSCMNMFRICVPREDDRHHAHLCSCRCSIGFGLVCGREAGVPPSLAEPRIRPVACRWRCGLQTVEGWCQSVAMRAHACVAAEARCVSCNCANGLLCCEPWVCLGGSFYRMCIWNIACPFNASSKKSYSRL